jgi:hypothetical protein
MQSNHELLCMNVNSCAKSVPGGTPGCQSKLLAAKLEQLLIGFLKERFE